MEMVFWDAIIAPSMAFGLFPNVLESVDIMSDFGNQFGMVDADIMEVRDIKDVIGLDASV